VIAIGAIPAALALVAAALVAAAPARAQSHHSQPSMVGGWGETAITPEVRAAAAFAVARLPQRHARLKRIDAARQQVVAGMNYEIDLTLTDRTRWRVRVWSKLDRTMALTSAVRLARADGALTR